MVKIKRAYEKPQTNDGFRILVDRLWPRGLSKDEGKIGLWLKEIAPSTSLRKWFSHDPEKWGEFQKRYQEELRNNPALNELKIAIKNHKAVTLVYGAKDERHNNAMVLKSMIKSNSLLLD